MRAFADCLMALEGITAAEGMKHEGGAWKQKKTWHGFASRLLALGQWPPRSPTFHRLFVFVIYLFGGGGGVGLGWQLAWWLVGFVWAG